MKNQKLDNESILRYSRQLVLPEIGVSGQVKLETSSVLIVGAGGLGCPAAIYLAAAGVGTLGVVDYDDVELNNLHRQILHTEQRVGSSKCESAASACNQLNSKVRCVTYKIQLNSQNAIEIISQYDIVLDATDNVASRYLLNDACVLCGKTLVSGSALRFEGQLTVYNHNNGPCYRCLYPTPPPPHTVTNCSDGGVLGVVPGIIGSMQALETIKIITGIGSSYSQRMLLFDALDASFRHVKLRPKQANCVVCGDRPSVTQLVDYEQFCGSSATDKTQSIKVVPREHRITCEEYRRMVEDDVGHVLVDVRPAVEQDICQLPGTNVHVEMNHLGNTDSREHLLAEIYKIKGARGRDPEVIVVCHLGNNSQLAVNKFREMLKDTGVVVRDMVGGLSSWAQSVDPSFPQY